MGIFSDPVTNKQDCSSLLTEIDRILAGVISSLVNPQEVTSETIIATRQHLESAKALLFPLLFPARTPEVARWSLGMEVQPEGVKIVFFRESQGLIDFYPLSWSLATGTSDRLPCSQVDEYLISWLSNRDFSHDSWLWEALERLEAIIISDDGETPTDDLKKALLTAQLIPPDRLSSLETAIATALAYIPTSDQPQPQTLLVIEGKRETTTLALLEVPPQTRSLSRQAIALSHFNYGENTYERAILSHLIYPLWRSFLPLSPSDLTDTNPLKKSLLAAARLTKLILQEESEFTSSLAGHTWTVSRRDLNKKVILPYLDNLRQKVNDLLEKQQKSLEDIDRIIFSGNFFLTIWPCFLTGIEQEFAGCNLEAPSQETFSPAILGLGRLCLFSALRGENGNNA
ncbi:MAG: hypothetical protein EWV75_12425 [Microcystis wesenbergii Mw_QC_S_20081001_S30D]|uniref:Uncharacterized protein n=1 Tax=Microcystis wesenbergii Mw_QC_S_20081001_S30D TaxID=2486245 RepID=A0A552JK57_9CHRO|nr:hypothetical protein [Microcystis aeruginosa W11-03]NCR94923.1 hypothetical protein [Microcystis aeruginosa W11-06]TRU94288.1 MAG: hypothetical protein EWV73_22915 [Microcystis wesenbergii Mw_QC_B_20070930_S4D]TRU95985.1 MAG: hypothetical protein EWV75_12425 [Microcystis wesenbergii Mw_QC_S_20081001_S30D]TRU99304.1 MAG: hypothetical protein EWV74_14260 [Microcystis wesenbergii Mw_QC_S_20081001_S30]TRV10018.1 MAG: hypothetical protein EWV89_17930 [Microcystis wesenbergii Mw_QC_B_20070930_S4]